MAVTPLEVLGGQKVVGTPATPNEIRRLLQSGMPREAFETVRDYLGLDAARMLALLDLHEAPAKGDRFSKSASSRLYRLAETIAHACDTFGSREKATQWLHRPNAALGGESPVELLDNDFGIDEVCGVLIRIDDGID